MKWSVRSFGPPKLATSAIVAATLVLAGCGSDFAQNGYYNPGKYHHTSEGFRNLPGALERKIEPIRFLRFFVKRMAYEFDPSSIPANHVVPADEARQQFAKAGNPRLTWIGHATFLIGFKGLNILTDPFFSRRASPFQNFGPERYVAPGMALQDLPPLDAIIISHNHYDSFDFPALTRLAQRKADSLVLVPLGLGDLTREAGFTNVREVDWYDQVKLGKVTFTSTPAIHWSRRNLGDTNQSLWNGFKIAGPGKSIWFVGDTAIGPMFEKEVAPRVGPVDIALVPIGAFLPRDFMRPMHTNPAEAVELARIMGAHTAIGMHWGTVPLGEDTPNQAVARFRAAQVPGVTKRLMRIGESISLDAP